MDEIDVDEDIALISIHDDVSTQDNIVQYKGLKDYVTTVIADILVSVVDTIVTTALTITAESTMINVEKRRKFFAAKRDEEKRNKPPTKAQQRNIMCNYLKNMEGWKPKSLKNKSFAKIQKLFDKAIKRVNTFVDYRTKLAVEGLKKYEVTKGSLKRTGEELKQERSKKQKVEDDKEYKELKQCLEIILDDGDEITINATPLFSKSPTIVDYKIYK
nr:hypothetical protein [Tanacetum cinerariifolium]